MGTKRSRHTNRTGDHAAAHLKRQLVYQTQRDRFGNLDALHELAISARECVASSHSAGHATVAFVLERVLDKCARDLDGRPVPISETASIGDRLRPPVLRAVEFLTGADDDPIETRADLIKAPPPRDR